MTWMGRARRYDLLTLLWVLLATAASPSTIRAAYAEVHRPAAQSVASAARNAKPAPSRQLDDTHHAPTTDRRRSTTVPQTFQGHPQAPFYDLYCSLLC
jgi:hypothetical protein